MAQLLHDEFAALCRRFGWKNTPQRLAVYTAIHENFTHPSVDVLWERVRHEVPAISRESIYRILNEFAEQGIIMRLDDLNSARYDWRTTPHGHFICRNCGKITDFPFDAGKEIPAEIDPATLSHVELRIVGLCAACRGKTK